MDFLKGIVENGLVQRICWTVIVVAIGLLIYRMITKVLNVKEKKNSRILSDKKNKTFIHMLKSIAACIIGVITVLVILEIYGVNVTSMLAGVGIASIVIGFALQDSLKDIIRGFVIISDDYYEIGDVIKFGDNIGPVVSVSLLTTKIQDINTMNIVSIANRNIDKVEVDPGYLYIDVPLPHEIKLAKAEMLMKGIAKQLARRKDILTVNYQGVSSISDSAYSHQLVVTCDPTNKLQTNREVLQVVISNLEKCKIHVPHDQLDIHTRK
ncbi:MAG: mechanosensitive ion channel family protein [Candidatus Saccharibacteria bacterium]|nr:mechanosensitive ion channel family protein [Candidatus Saccharibacteria bacterium]